MDIKTVINYYSTPVPLLDTLFCYNAQSNRIPLDNSGENYEKTKTDTLIVKCGVCPGDQQQLRVKHE